MCSKGPAPSYGLTKGAWISGRFDAGGGLTGSFNWLDLGTVNGENGANAVTTVLAGQGQCNLSKTTPVGKTGSLGNNAGKAWNSRFGLYQGGGGNPNVNTSPPDYTGYPYTATNWPSQSNAYANFEAKRHVFASYGDTTDTVSAGNTISGLSVSNAYNVATHGTSGQHGTKGADRRVAIAPIVDCAAWASAQKIPILDFACILMLHPIDNPNAVIRMEFLGLASEIGTPCSTFGLAGGTVGPMVPVLVH
jgi:hypothetical protein